MKELLSLFYSFAKIGLFTFGGGYAMLPMFTRVLVEEKKWTDEREILDYFAIAQCTPGVIAVNTATFVGAKRKGVLGAVAATLGVVFPSLVIIILIAAFLNNFGENEIIKNAFSGIRVAVCALITVSVFKMAKKSIIDLVSAFLGLTAFVSVAFFGISPVFPVLAGGVFGALRAVFILKKSGRGGANK